MTLKKKKPLIKVQNVSEEQLFREINSLIGIGRQMIVAARKEKKPVNVWLVRFTTYAASLMTKLQNARKEAGRPITKVYKPVRSTLKARK